MTGFTDWSGLVPKPVAIMQHAWERKRYAYRAHACGLTYGAIARRLGVSVTRARDLSLGYCLQSPVEAYQAQPPATYFALAKRLDALALAAAERQDAALCPCRQCARRREAAAARIAAKAAAEQDVIDRRAAAVAAHRSIAPAGHQASRQRERDALRAAKADLDRCREGAEAAPARRLAASASLDAARNRVPPPAIDPEAAQAAVSALLAGQPIPPAPQATADRQAALDSLRALEAAYQTVCAETAWAPQAVVAATARCEAAALVVAIGIGDELAERIDGLESTADQAMVLRAKLASLGHALTRRRTTLSPFAEAVLQRGPAGPFDPDGQRRWQDYIAALANDPDLDSPE